MIVFAHADHPLVAKALDLARTWYSPELVAHTQHIAATVSTHISAADPELIAAALLTHSPQTEATHTFLATQFSSRLARIVQTSANEYQELDACNSVNIAMQYVEFLIQSDHEATYVNTAEKIVTLTKLRAHNYNLVQYDLSSHALAVLRIYMTFYYDQAAIILPKSLAAELHRLITAIPH